MIPQNHFCQDAELFDRCAGQWAQYLYIVVAAPSADVQQDWSDPGSYKNMVRTAYIYS